MRGNQVGTDIETCDKLCRTRVTFLEVGDAETRLGPRTIDFLTREEAKLGKSLAARIQAL